MRNYNDNALTKRREQDGTHPNGFQGSHEQEFASDKAQELKQFYLTRKCTGKWNRLEEKLVKTRATLDKSHRRLHQAPKRISYSVVQDETCSGVSNQDALGSELTRLVRSNETHVRTDSSYLQPSKSRPGIILPEMSTAYQPSFSNDSSASQFVRRLDTKYGDQLAKGDAQTKKRLNKLCNTYLHSREQAQGDKIASLSGEDVCVERHLAFIEDSPAKEHNLEKQSLKTLTNFPEMKRTKCYVSSDHQLSDICKQKAVECQEQGFECNNEPIRKVCTNQFDKTFPSQSTDQLTSSGVKQKPLAHPLENKLTHLIELRSEIAECMPQVPDKTSPHISRLLRKIKKWENDFDKTLELDTSAKERFARRQNASKARARSSCIDKIINTGVIINSADLASTYPKPSVQVNSNNKSSEHVTFSGTMKSYPMQHGQVGRERKSPMNSSFDFPQLSNIREMSDDSIETDSLMRKCRYENCYSATRTDPQLRREKTAQPALTLTFLSIDSTPKDTTHHDKADGPNGHKLQFEGDDFVHSLMEPVNRTEPHESSLSTLRGPGLTLQERSHGRYSKGGALAKQAVSVTQRCPELSESVDSFLNDSNSYDTDLSRLDLSYLEQGEKRRCGIKDSNTTSLLDCSTRDLIGDASTSHTANVKTQALNQNDMKSKIDPRDAGNELFEKDTHIHHSLSPPGEMMKLMQGTLLYPDLRSKHRAIEDEDDVPEYLSFTELEDLASLKAYVDEEYEDWFKNEPNIAENPQSNSTVRANVMSIHGSTPPHSFLFHYERSGMLSPVMEEDEE